MSSSPFMTPSQSRLRRERQAMRRRRRLLTLTVFALVLAAGAGAMALANRHAPHTGRAAAHLTRRSEEHPRTAPRSQLGLPLATPPLHLSGPTAATGVRVAFVHPPSAGMLFDLDDGRVFWDRRPYVRLRIASLTKMMTALLVVGSSNAREQVLVTKQAVRAAGSKVGVLPLGKQVPLESMLYGLLLPSGNDAAVALAQHIAGSIIAFVRRMNVKAAELGLGCTRYSSPSGYLDMHNYSCAADLAVLAHADLAQPRIAHVAGTYRAVLPFPIKGGKLYLDNNNPLEIYGYPGITGLKTGYTEAAGRCLVATARRDGVSLGVVLLNSPDPATQARKLLDSAFEQVFHQPVVREPPIPASE
jgi:D-alanyl-D-alanine carboxypeptidase